MFLVARVVDKYALRTLWDACAGISRNAALAALAAFDPAMHGKVDIRAVLGLLRDGTRALLLL